MRAEPILKWLEAGFLGALIFLAVQCGIFVRRAQRALPGAAQDLSATLADYRRLAEDTVGVTAQVRNTLQATQDSAKQVAENSASSTALLAHDLEIFGALLGDADTAVGRADQTLGRIDLAVRKAAPAVDHLNDAAAKLPPILESVRLSAEDFQATSRDSASIARHVNAIAGNGETASNEALARFNQMLKPPRLAARILLDVTGEAGKLFEGIYYGRQVLENRN
jgi:methyl-accepting chemotaxis protein